MKFLSTYKLFESNHGRQAAQEIIDKFFDYIQNTLDDNDNPVSSYRETEFGKYKIFLTDLSYSSAIKIYNDIIKIQKDIELYINRKILIFNNTQDSMGNNNWVQIIIYQNKKNNRLLESVKEDIDKINDILSDIKDNGFNCHVTNLENLKFGFTNPIGSRYDMYKVGKKPYIKIMISVPPNSTYLSASKYIDRIFSWNSVKADIDELISQLSDTYEYKIMSIFDFSKIEEYRTTSIYTSKNCIDKNGIVKPEFANDDILHEIQIYLYKI